jgi:TfoX/Sxy family transcriptional regulator of competence genes
MQMGYRRMPERCLDEPDEFLTWARASIAVAERVATKPAKRKVRPMQAPD